MKLSITTFKAFVYGTIILIAAAASASSFAKATPKSQNFAGTWTSKECITSKLNMHCYTFVLYLVQNGNDICGSHFAATSSGPENPITHQIDDDHEDFGKLDEGDPGSVIGSIVNNIATLVIRSTRTGEYYIARSSIHHKQIKFTMIGRFTGTDESLPDEILPQGVSILLSPGKFDLVSDDGKPLDLKGICRWPTFNPTFNKSRSNPR